LGSGGNGGIPLWAELKTLVGLVTDEAGEMLAGFAAHTRANTRFDDVSIVKALGFDPDVANLRSFVHGEDDGAPGVDDELRSRWFGRVNPFNVDAVLADMIGTEVVITDVRQVVDTSLELPGGTPDTVMTNVGDRTL